ncbi:SDR family NAD(P)-dependent oxidoreductase [Myxococcota bacterium]|nr:SDR family NAD(P)-dependent oxidoreductase [Myxococcota bacterium]
MSERRALVVGATGALGPAMCRALKAGGYRLVLVGRRPDPLTRLARSLSGRALPWDITRDPALLLDLAGPVTLLVNAAVRRPLPADDEEPWSPEVMRRLLEVNAVAPAQLVRAFAARLDAPGLAVLLTEEEPPLSPYAASIAALETMGPALVEDHPLCALRFLSQPRAPGVNAARTAAALMGLVAAAGS